MLDFKYPQLEDKEFINKIIRTSPHKGCVYSFALALAWRDYYLTRICRRGDALLFLSGEPGEEYYLFPVGSFDIAELMKLMHEDSQQRGFPLRIVCAEPWQAQMVMQALPGRYEYTPDRDDFDYIYSVDTLANLAGRKYHGKRNHIAKFTRAHPDWRYETLTQSNIAECRAAAQKWYIGKSDHSLLCEQEAIGFMLDNFAYLEQKGGMIRADGEIVAFCIGEAINDDIFVVHFEKALPGYEEAYSVINREFAANGLKGFKYVNREEDMGLEGLRRAKLSYYPELLLEKFTITPIQADRKEQQPQ